MRIVCLQDNKVKGDAAKLLRATYEAMEIAIRMLRPETKNMEITAAIDKVGKSCILKLVDIHLVYDFSKYFLQVLRESRQMCKG